MSRLPPSPIESSSKFRDQLEPEAKDYFGQPPLPSISQRRSFSTRSTPRDPLYGGSSASKDEEDMASQSKRGYQHGTSRESASGRPNLGQRASSRGIDRDQAHLLSPVSASGFSGSGHTSTRGLPPGSARTTSPYTPEVVLTKADRPSEEEEEEEITSSSEDEDDYMGEREGYKSGAERLAEKRKMKRFRLTHTQTRFLMSEFARQAHPNAEQRERLSRDIPGLSPRQVQVWFQNRRAKLKRLTTDDQERMMRSRALPEDFDLAPTLQSGFREPRSPYESMPSLNYLSLTGGGMDQRPAVAPGSERRKHSPTVQSSVYADYPPGAGSVTGSANLSPVSSINEGSQYSSSQYSENLSPLSASTHLSSPFSRSNSLSTPLQPQQRQVDQSWRRTSSFIQPNPVFGVDVGDYRDYGTASTSQTPYPAQPIPQHDATFPQGLDVAQRLSPLNPSDTFPYNNRRQATYPQPAAAPGYHGPPYTSHDTELSAWQGGQQAPGGLQYGLPNPQPEGALRTYQPRQSQGTSNPIPGTHIYNPSSSYQYADDPRMMAEPGPQNVPPLGNPPASGYDTHAGSGARRRRGGTHPGYWPDQQ